jgi:hypothetical protein
MPTIRDVKVEPIREIGIPPVRSIFTGLPEPVITNISPPVTITIGSPIVDLPGCVEYNPAGPGVDNDPNGNRIICDATAPSFNPIDYDPDDMVFTGPPEPIPELDLETPEIPQTPLPPTPKPPDVPFVTATEEEKEETVEIIEEPTFVEKYLPSANEVTTTVTVAMAAATAAVFGKPLAELLLKIIRPSVKKIVQKAKNKVGVKEVVLSVSERRQLQRDLRK